MTDKINIQKIASLAMLELNEHEIAPLQKKFEEIKTYFDQISSIVIEELPSDTPNKDLIPYRTDQFEKNTDRPPKEFSNFTAHNRFTVPKIID